MSQHFFPLGFNLGTVISSVVENITHESYVAVVDFDHVNHPSQDVGSSCICVRY